MVYDFNLLERRARTLFASGRPHDAIRLDMFMADGDPSLDGGYLGKRIGECYETMGQLYAAKYWYGRALEENPNVRLDCAETRKRLEALTTLDDLMSSVDPDQ